MKSGHYAFWLSLGYLSSILGALVVTLLPFIALHLVGQELKVQLQDGLIIFFVKGLTILGAMLLSLMTGYLIVGRCLQYFKRYIIDPRLDALS